MKLMAVFFLFFIYSTSSFSKELFAMENETEVRLCNNYKDIHHCFTENIESKSSKNLNLYKMTGISIPKETVISESISKDTILINIVIIEEKIDIEK